MAGLATERGEAREKGEPKRGLTAGSRTSSESSGEIGQRRAGGGDLRWPAMKTTRVAMMEAVRRFVARRGGGGGCGGARKRVGEARGGRWRWLWRTAATDAFGRSGEREPGEGGGMRERERGAGRHVASSGSSRVTRRKQEVAGRVAAAGCGAGTHLLGRGGRRRQRSWRAGPPPGWAGLLLLGCAGESPR